MFDDASYCNRVKRDALGRDITTLEVGGPIDFIVEVLSVEELADVVRRTKYAALPLIVIGEGSNIIVGDDGLRGVVVILKMKSCKIEENDNAAMVTVEAGVRWDDFVKNMVEEGYSGVEAMSGVPGTVGASPVQNIGCYGEELSDVFIELLAYDTIEEKLVTLSKKQCKFGYRTSFFKRDESRRYIILSIKLELTSGLHKISQYPDLQAYFLENKINAPSLADVREAVLSIRRGKSMVLDKSDVNTKSVGSFFTNPIISKNRLEKIQTKYGEVPYYNLASGEVKIPAAWLVEKSGFKKGYREGAVGISSNHSLAIINLAGASAADILKLSDKIHEQVFKNFGVDLQKEPQVL